jgi:hypothetical protein
MANTSIGLEGAAAKAGTPKVTKAEASEATNQRFSEAMEKAQSDLELNPQQVAPQQVEQAASQQVNATSEALPSKPVLSTDASDAADAQERARRALNLGPIHAKPNTSGGGEAILHGLEKMRGLFNAQEARLINFASSPMDTQRLMALQMDAMNFSLVVTVASKLTGNSAQALESLLKGQ